MGKILISYLIIIFLFYTGLSAQYNNEVSSGVAPWLPAKFNCSTNSALTNPQSVGFAYYPVGANNSQLFRFKVGTPGLTTLIGSAKPYLLGNGDFANPTGVWKYYVQDLNSPFTIFEVDTANGNLTSVGIPGPIKSGHKPLDLEWDHITNSFYIVSSDSLLTETQLYKMYWSTKQLTWIGTAVTRPKAIIAGGFNANGTYFGIDLVSDSLWKVNKNTGLWKNVGYLGYPVNFAQDAGFDRSDFSKMLWCASGGTVGLYEVDTSNAQINFINSFPSYSQVLAVGFTAGSGGPQITVSKLSNTENLSGPYVVNAVVTPGGANITATKLFWSRNNTLITDSVVMTNTGGNNWTGSIPGNGSPALYRYYGFTFDALNRSAVYPLGAPSNLFSFYAQNVDTSKPVIDHTPIGNIIKSAWPVSVSATVTDNFGLDSVWVRWRKNSGSGKILKLPLINGNIFTAIFNSVNSDVVARDTIYYRVIAQDNSANHNRDSTVLYSFKILPGEFSCIGTGTALVQGLPFNTQYYGSRTQFLWDAVEIINAGGSSGFITRMGFDIYSAITLPMNNFAVKLQDYYDTATTSFVDNNWTTVFSGTYAITGTGWQYIIFQNPFEWNGTSNLLVQICFENNTNSLYSVFKATATSRRVCVFEYHDLASACTAFNTPNIWTFRPNVCFKIDQALYTGNNNGFVNNFMLSQNFPNPFNPLTRINFEIAKQGFVTLNVYDALGRLVNQIVNEVKSAGKYSVDFNASGLPSGIYFYKIEFNGNSETKRMILLK